MGRFLAAGFSLFIPGLGHLFYGQFFAGFFWWVTSWFLGPIAGVAAAVHVFMISE